MPLTIRPTRYAHQEGHTGVCYYDGEKGGLVTCGADGDVRYWLDLMDDDPSSSCVAEQAIAIVSKNGKLYVGDDNNVVQILSFPSLEKDGTATRFSASVCALTTAKTGKFIVSGSGDNRIRATDVETLENIEFYGHEAPVLGLSLDPKEEYIASSSADGSIRIWSIGQKKCIHVWKNIVPKCNSFVTASAYATPSFHPKDGSTVAYPHYKEVVIVERETWKEKTRLSCPEIRMQIGICAYSYCGTRLAASSVHGEIVVWDVESGEVVGYAEHHQNPKITTLVWHLEKSDELAFCDSFGQLGCVDVIAKDKSKDGGSSGAAEMGDIEDDLDLVGGEVDRVPGIDGSDDDDDDENVISLNKIKKSVRTEDDEDEDKKSRSDFDSERIIAKAPEINMQAPFQPGSSPVHLLSRFMLWNDVGLVRCYMSEDGEESSIEVEFHDATIHHAIHMNNYLGHTLAALSSRALALGCRSGDGVPSKLVVVVLQGWGSGSKEWSVELPEGEECECLAAGDSFIALATSRRNLRLFMICGTQREVLALPGAPVALNAFGNDLVATYHAGVGISKDQRIKLMWVKLRGPNLRNETLEVPLSPCSELTWLGLTDLASPIVVDEDGLVKIYDRKSCLWRVACDTERQRKGKLDHFFVIGVSEKDCTMRCVLCKGSRYPATTPRPTVTEISMTLPLCEPDSEKSAKEAQLWQIGNHPHKENEAVLSLIALACRSNAEFRAVEICERIASEKVIELAIKYAGRIQRLALANKLESIADEKESRKGRKLFVEENEQQENVVSVVEEEEEAPEPVHSNGNDSFDSQEDIMLTPVAQRRTEEAIKPLTLSGTRNNPFIKSAATTTAKGLGNLNTMPEKAPKRSTPVAKPRTTKKTQQSKIGEKEKSFPAWLAKNREELQEEFPDLGKLEFNKVALARYKELESEGAADTSSELRKRKLSSPDSQNDQSKRSAPNKLADFLYDK